MSCFVQYAPYKLADGTWDDQREAFGDTVVNTISPNTRRNQKNHHRPPGAHAARYGAQFGLTQGNIFQGELSLEQLFFLRPVPGWALLPHSDRNLYMCGSATHPGGGIMGAPGRVSGHEILKDGRGRS